MSHNGTTNGVNGHNHHQTAPDHSGVNFCPGCGCNIKAVGLALLFASNIGKTVTAGVAPVARTSRLTIAAPIKRTRTNLNPEIKAKIFELRKNKLFPKQIAKEMRLKLSTVNYVLYAKPAKKAVSRI